MFIHECKIDKNICTEFMEIMVSKIVVENGLADPLDPKPDLSTFNNKRLDQAGQPTSQPVSPTTTRGANQWQTR